MSIAGLPGFLPKEESKELIVCSQFQHPWSTSENHWAKSISRAHCFTGENFCLTTRGVLCHHTDYIKTCCVTIAALIHILTFLVFQGPRLVRQGSAHLWSFSVLSRYRDVTHRAEEGFVDRTGCSHGFQFCVEMARGVRWGWSGGTLLTAPQASSATSSERLCPPGLPPPPSTKAGPLFWLLVPSDVTGKTLS